MSDEKESRDKFKRADELFRGESFAEALALLIELDAAHPNTRNILVPMALCLDRLGREDEALLLCERLVRQFADTRARTLLERLRLPRALPAVHVDALLGDQDYASAYDLPDLGPITTVAVPVQSEEEESRWPLVLVCVGCVLLIVGLLALPLMLGDSSGGDAGPGSMPVDQAGVVIGFALAVFAFAVFTGTLTGVLALGALGKLPANSIGAIVLDVGGTILVVNLISAVLNLLVFRAESLALAVVVALIQIGILLYAFRRNYGLSAGELVAFAVMYLVLSCVLLALPLMAFFGVAGILAFFFG